MNSLPAAEGQHSGPVRTAASSGALVELENVDKVFGTHFVLRGVDFALRPGERILLYGPNGAGKSTLLKILASLTPPTTGSVRHLEGRSGVGAFRARLGYLGHSTMVYVDLTGRENLQFFASMRGVGRERVGAWLAEVGLDRAADQPVRTYSAGMRQRLAVARTLLHGPDILLLDEPFNSLDGDLVARLSGWLRPRSVVLVTHQLDLGAALATRAVEVREGRVREAPLPRGGPGAAEFP